MSTRNAGTRGSTRGERNERIPAPNAIATFTRPSLGCLPRVHDKVEAIETAGPFQRHPAFVGDVSRAGIGREDERDDAPQSQLAEAVLDEHPSRLGRIAVTPGTRRELVRDFDRGALSLDREEADLSQELRRLLELERPKPHAPRLTRGERHRPPETLPRFGDVLGRRTRLPLHPLGRTENLVQCRRIVVAVWTDDQPFRLEWQRH